VTDPDVRRLQESLGAITANLSALQVEMDRLVQIGPPRGKKGPVKAEPHAEGAEAPIGVPVNGERPSRPGLQDLPVLPPPGVEIGELLGPIFERVSRTVRVERLIFFLRETGEDSLTPRASRGFRRDDLTSFSLGLGEGITGRAFHEGRPIRASIPVPGSGPGNGMDPLLSRFPVREAIALPVRSDTNIVGVLYAGRTSPIAFEDSDLVLLAFFADRIGTWVHAAAVFGRMHHQVARLKELIHLSLKITSSREPSQIFASTAEVGAGLLRVETAAIVVVDPDGTLSIQGSVGFPPGFEAEWRGRRSEGVVGGVVQTGQPFISTDLLASPSPVFPFGPKFPGRGLLLLPLKVHDETFGCLVLADPRPRVFSSEELEVATLLAAEAALAIENARLYGQARHAYEDLKAAQDQLVLTEKTRALGEIAGGIAHDFNNILAIILGTAELMLERVQNTSTRKGLETIEEAAWRGAETVRRLQRFAATGGEEEFVPVNLNAIILDAVGVTRPRWKDEAEAQGLRVEVATDLEELPPIQGNPVELREMVVNLLFNALDAMPEGGRAVVETRSSGGPSGGIVEVSVSDTGVGMSEETRRRIFDPFFTTKGPRYSGLGLAVVHGVVARHHGQVEVSSEEGKGTRCVIRFPVGSEVTTSRQSPPLIKIPGRPAELREPARILVIEDETHIRGLLVQILMSEGHTVRWAVDGQHGLALFEKEEFDIVFTDLSMPEVSGWEVTHAVKKTDPRIPVVLATGWGDQLDPQRLQESGVDLVLAKPFRVEQVLSALTDALARRRPLPR